MLGLPHSAEWASRVNQNGFSDHFPITMTVTVGDKSCSAALKLLETRVARARLTLTFDVLIAHCRVRTHATAEIGGGRQ